MLKYLIRFLFVILRIIPYFCIGNSSKQLNTFYMKINIELNQHDFDVLFEALSVYRFNAQFSKSVRFDYNVVNNIYLSMLGFETRGLRNNNPFNIKKSSSNWVGKKLKSIDPDFEQFENMYYGLRAGMKLLVNYVNKGFNTPYKIIERFAPASENNFASYLSFVVRSSDGRVVLSPNDPIKRLSDLCYLASRMVLFENGINRNTLFNIKADCDSLLELCKFYKFNLK